MKGGSLEEDCGEKEEKELEEVEVEEVVEGDSHGVTGRLTGRN